MQSKPKPQAKKKKLQGYYHNNAKTKSRKKKKKKVTPPVDTHPPPSASSSSAPPSASSSNPPSDSPSSDAKPMLNRLIEPCLEAFQRGCRGVDCAMLRSRNIFNWRSSRNSPVLSKPGYSSNPPKETMARMSETVDITPANAVTPTTCASELPPPPSPLRPCLKESSSREVKGTWVPQVVVRRTSTESSSKQQKAKKTRESERYKRSGKRSGKQSPYVTPRTGCVVAWRVQLEEVRVFYVKTPQSPKKLAKNELAQENTQVDIRLGLSKQLVKKLRMAENGHSRAKRSSNPSSRSPTSVSKKSQRKADRRKAERERERSASARRVDKAAGTKTDEPRRPGTTKKAAAKPENESLGRPNEEERQRIGEEQRQAAAKKENKRKANAAEVLARDERNSKAKFDEVEGRKGKCKG